jgi:hypothetical protein
MLRKIQMLGLALFAVFASSAVLAGMASAETTLLAEWLRNGVAIAANLASETSGEITLEDTSTLPGKVAVLCSVILDGTVGANGAAEITEALDLSKEAISLTALVPLALECSNVTKCESGTPSLLWLLPSWNITLFLMENSEILALITGFAFEVTCLVLGFSTSDLCEAADTEFKVINEGGAAEIPAGENLSPAASCTAGTSSSGIITTDVLAPITLVEGGTLSVSSE